MNTSVDQIRNIALVGHGGAGKTSLAEFFLYKTKVSNRLGRTEEGNTAMDFEPEEIRRQTSISTAFHQFEWAKHTINVIDTPGDQNFFADTRTCIQAADGVVVVIDAVDGVKVQTEQAWELAREFGLPALIFINKLDRERSDFTRTFKNAADTFDPKPIVAQLPIGSETDFKGVIDLVPMQAFEYDPSGKRTKIEIPADMKQLADEERERLVEHVAEADDDLLERYLEGEELTDQDIKAALKKGVLSRTFVPVLCGSATRGIGVDSLMDILVDLLPSPVDRGSWTGIDPDSKEEIERSPDPEVPFSAFVFKTVADPYSGRLSIFRIVSGTLKGDGNLLNVNKDTKERYSQLLRLAGKEQKPENGAGPGSIVALAKLKYTGTGDTLCSETEKIVFTCADAPVPQISFAVKSKTAGDEDTSEPADDSSADSDDLSSEPSALQTVSLEQPEWSLPATQIIVLTMMAIMAVGLLTSTATAILASEGARFAILLAVMGPLLAITQRGEGGIFTRGRLLGFIEAHPGIHFSALRDALELGNGVTAHHIQILEKEGRVISWMDGRVRRFASSGVDQTRLQEIQNPVTGMQIAILQILSESGALGIHTGELRTQLETSRQLLSYHMKQLSERNFVKSSGRGRSIRWNLLDEGQEKLDNSTHLTNV